MINYYLAVLRKYAVFEGRASRSEYWWFTLVNVIISLLLTIANGSLSAEGSMNILAGIYGLLVFIPSLAVTVRRLHDIGKSGWWILIGIIPLIGTIVLLVFAVMESNPESNEYGPKPSNNMSGPTPTEPTTPTQPPAPTV